MSKRCVISAPGKVLITGGYLVLDPAYRGLVLGTNARFYAAIQMTKQPPVVNPTPSIRTNEYSRFIHVNAPQFIDATWVYHIQTREEDSNKVWKLVDVQYGYTAGNNPFIQAALRLSLAYAEHSIGGNIWNKHQASDTIKITMLADNDFYSQHDQLVARQLPVSRQGLEALPRFCPTDRPLREVNKAGLGSSAALTTSLVGAILAFLDVCQPDDVHGRRIVHNLAQACHCYAQGKIGSGFDVSSAVNAGHAYRRFSPAILDTFLAMNIMNASHNRITLIRWDSKVQCIRLAPSLVLMMADVAAGSHTPSMVSKVLAWRKQNPIQADTLWKTLNDKNELVLVQLMQLQTLYTEDRMSYEKDMQTCRLLPASNWSNTSGSKTISVLIDIHNTFQQIRRLLREMGELAGVPIEPLDQTQLLDECLTIPGVLMAGVPGAGGNDAVFCIVLGEDVIPKVDQLWSTWTQAKITPLLCAEAFDGIRHEEWSLSLKRIATVQLRLMAQMTNIHMN
ncbi:Phosphomevalonate kinase [Syncephalis plumigaleata]|nr:Phosphomevalonate kinase [Syncephalis plumigaleata]